MLVEIDAALTRSRTKEFRALDELTPRIADARAATSGATSDRNAVPRYPYTGGWCSHSSSARASTSRTPSRATSPATTTATSSSRSGPSDFRYEQGRLTIHLAREFGFCYGVDRAVDYAYQARMRFPDSACS